MFKALVAFGFSLSLAACAGTVQQASTAGEECKLVDQEATGTLITVKQECTGTAGGEAAGAPKR